MTLWSTHDDEGALLVLEEGAGNTYDLTGDSSEGLAVDIGSNLGAVTIGIARHYPFWTVLSAEAMPITFLYLIANLWLNEPAAMAARRIVPAFAALGRNGGAAHLQLREGSLTSSRGWNPASEWTRTTANLTVPTVSLSSLLRAVKLNPTEISLLKLDCEGCEYDFVPALTPDQISAISRVVGETHYHEMLRSGRPIPPRSAADLTHDRLCRHWHLCVDPLTGDRWDPTPPPPLSLAVGFLLARWAAAAALCAGVIAVAMRGFGLSRSRPARKSAAAGGGGR